MTSQRTLATCFRAAGLLLVLIGPATSISRQLNEGDQCWDGGVPGTCRSLQYCDQARRNLQQGRPLPKRCGFVGTEEVVCCAQSEDSSSSEDRDGHGNGVDSGDSRDVYRETGSSDSEDWSRGHDNGNHHHQSGGSGRRRPPGVTPLGWGSNANSNNKRGYPENDRGTARDSNTRNENGDGQLGSWNTRKPVTSSFDSWNTPKPVGTSSPSGWKPRKPSTSSFDNWNTPKTTSTSSSSSWNNRKPPGSSSFVGWNTPKPAGTFSAGGWNTRKPTPDSWENSRDGHLEKDSSDSDRVNENRPGNRDTRQPVGTSSQRRTQDCESYKNFLNVPSVRIVSGKNAGKREFPHMAALGYQLPGKKELSWLCGGSLISDQYVLTAAHCCSSRERSAPVRVQLGTLDLSSTSNDQRYGVSEVIIHPDYSKPSYQGDIALIKLDRKVTLSETVCPACLYNKSGDPQTGLIVTGWGSTNAIGTRQSPVLLKTTIRPFPLLKCEQLYKERFPEGLDSSVMCAGDPEGKAGTCDGDSGGPLQIKEDVLIFSIVGITSIGPSPCGGTLPSVYTRVSSYIEWIEKHVWS